MKVYKAQQRIYGLILVNVYGVRKHMSVPSPKLFFFKKYYKFP